MEPQAAVDIYALMRLCLMPVSTMLIGSLVVLWKPPGPKLEAAMQVIHSCVEPFVRMLFFLPALCCWRGDCSRRKRNAA